MKTVLLLVVIAVIALVTYNFITTGNFKVLPSTESKGEAAKLKDLEGRLHKAFETYRETEDGNAVDDFNAPSERRRIRLQIEEMERELKEMKSASKAMEIRGQAEKLLDEITEFRLDTH